MSRRTGPDADVLVALERRSVGRCERCGGRATNTHHRRPRRMGGTKDPAINALSKLVRLCGSGTTGCHGWVESHRAEAIAQGWILPHQARATEVPVLLWRGWGLLTDAGTYVPVSVGRFTPAGQSPVVLDGQESMFGEEVE